jgi:hypothetical protein
MDRTKRQRDATVAVISADSPSAALKQTLLDEIITLYEVWNELEKANEWRVKLPQTETVKK